jgi:hypothetical protein
MGEESRCRRCDHRCINPTLPLLLTQIAVAARAHAELFLFCLLLANILQATIAIRSPPAPYPPLPSPSKALSPTAPSRSKEGQQRTTTTMTPPTWRGKSGGLSPNITPQRQLAFSTTTPAGSSNRVSAGAGGSASVGSASDPRGLAQSYKLAFTNLPTSSPDISIGSSTGSNSLPPSPSPAQATSPLAAYRGRRAPTGRSSLLLHLGFCKI